MARRRKDDTVSSSAEKAFISQFSRSALKQVNPDGSKPPLVGAGKGWQGGVIAVTGPANPDQQVLTRDESLPPPTKASVQNPTRLLQQYRLLQNRQAAAAQTPTPTTPSPPPPTNTAQEPPPRPAVSLPAAPPSMSTPAPHRTVSKHAPPPPSAPAPKPPAPTMSAPSAWAPPLAPPPPPPAHPRPPVENGSAWKDYVGDQPADTVQPIRNWAQGRSDFAAKNKFKAPPVRSPGYGGTTTTTAHTATPSSVQRPSLPSMPPSMTAAAKNGAPPPPSSLSSWNVAGSKVASLANRGGVAAATTAAAATKSPSMVADNGATAPGPTKPTLRAKTGATSTSNETHLSKWATMPAPSVPAAAAAAPSPPPATAPASTSRAAPPVTASPTPPAASASAPPPAAAASTAADSTSSSPSSSKAVGEEEKDAKAVPHLTINGIASGSGRSSTTTTTTSSSSSAPSVAPPPARTADAGTAPTTDAAALPPPIPSTSTSASSSTLKTSQPSKTTAAFIASASAASKSTPPPSSPTASSFKLNGAAVDFEMPAKKEYRAPDWVEKPQERTNVEEMAPKLEKLSISTPVQKRVQQDKTRATRSPRGSPMLPPADRARLASGGPQRVKKTREELDELMARMKLKNEETRKEVEAADKDRARYESSQAEQQYERPSSLQRRVDEQQPRVDDEEQAKRERTAALQKTINEERARTAAAKLRAKSGRAWDAGKVPASSSSDRAASPTPAPAVLYPSIEAEAREARRRRAEENHEQRVPASPAREITEEEAERIRRRDGVRGDDGGWETVVHHEGTGRAETVVR